MAFREKPFVRGLLPACPERSVEISQGLARQLAWAVRYIVRWDLPLAPCALGNGKDSLRVVEFGAGLGCCSCEQLAAGEHELVAVLTMRHQVGGCEFVEFALRCGIAVFA